MPFEHITEPLNPFKENQDTYFLPGGFNLHWSVSLKESVPKTRVEIFSPENSLVAKAYLGSNGWVIETRDYAYGLDCYTYISSTFDRVIRELNSRLCEAESLKKRA